ncbi:chromate transporter [Brevibacillus humidisoli]|uniref:chromate transporter n=1 Tax=Brevibacillus humidisoli TaxID=2895522 RepID=UPI001E5951C6|nr:chromate transporter [Brevibacillus humidisoli]UFJ40602.1 chromate transporter [Brevibacillus humidisoli]
MTLWYLFLAFLVPSIVAYGGGPSAIPLIQHEVVDRYHFLTMEGFGQILALANALPGPIATKLAGYIGYQVAGGWGAVVALFATVAPSLAAMIMLLGLLYRFKDSPKAKSFTQLVKPTVAILLLVVGIQFFVVSIDSVGMVQTLMIGAVSWVVLEKWKLHPVWMIGLSLLYGAFVLS